MALLHARRPEEWGGEEKFRTYDKDWDKYREMMFRDKDWEKYRMMHGDKDWDKYREKHHMMHGDKDKDKYREMMFRDKDWEKYRKDWKKHRMMHEDKDKDKYREMMRDKDWEKYRKDWKKHRMMHEDKDKDKYRRMMKFDEDDWRKYRHGEKEKECTLCDLGEKYRMREEDVHRMHPRFGMFGEREKFFRAHPELFRRHEHYAGEMFSPRFMRRDYDEDLDFLRKRRSRHGGDLSSFYEMKFMKKHKEKKWKPVCDLGETHHYWLVRAELPGVKKDKLEVEVEGKRLIIIGKRKKEILHGEKLREKMSKKRKEKEGKDKDKDKEREREREREREKEKEKEKLKEKEKGIMFGEKGKEGELLRGKEKETEKGKEGELERGKEKRVCTNHNCSCGSNCTCGPTCKCGTMTGTKEERKGDFAKDKEKDREKDLKKEDIWKEVKWWHKERGGKGKFKRKIHLPKKVDPSSIDALYKDGVLEILIKKPEGLESKKMGYHNVAIH